MMLRRYHQRKEESQPATKKPVEPSVPAEKPKRRGRRKKDDEQ